MSCQIKILPSAWEDLKKIEDYYVVEFDAVTAIKVCNSILNALEKLEKFPESGSSTPDLWLNSMGYRMVIIQKFVAIYRHIDDSIFIYHIANTQTDYTKLFF